MNADAVRQYSGAGRLPATPTLLIARRQASLQAIAHRTRQLARLGAFVSDQFAKVIAAREFEEFIERAGEFRGP